MEDKLSLIPPRVCDPLLVFRAMAQRSDLTVQLYCSAKVPLKRELHFMPDTTNPYVAASEGHEKSTTDSPNQDASNSGRSYGRFAGGAGFAVLSIATVVYAIHEMRAGVVELSSPVAARKPSEIAAEIMHSGLIGYLAAAICLVSLLVMLSGYRRVGR